MAGVTKHIYDANIREIQKQWSMQIRSLIPLLPKYYDKNTIVELLKKYYPHEWQGVEYKYIYYSKKDAHIKRRTGKRRYYMPCPTALLEKNSAMKKILEQSQREEHAAHYSDEECQLYARELMEKRKPKIEKIDRKIDLAKSKTQQVTPKFIDQLMGFYERKNTSQKDRMYILHELMKYYNEKVINFLFKRNDTELNRQLRETAFYHLQSFNYAPRLRRQKYMQVHTKNKKRKKYLKKVYPFETYTIPHNPQELEYRIQNGKEQGIKTFDFFISHSSMDSREVQDLISYENANGKNVFCDWISDSDYLKRNLLCNATLKVIEWRLKQSEAIIFVRSQNSLNSKWCIYELNYFYRLDKPIYVIDIESIRDNSFSTKILVKDSFYVEDMESILSPKEIGKK